MSHEGGDDESYATAKSKISVKDYVDPRQVRLIWQEAMYEASLTKGVISISWKSVPFIDPVLYDFHHKFGKPLVHVRLIGVKLKVLPEEFALTFRELEALSLENNQLELIPDNVTQLTQLRELYLANNFLRHLPERIGYLCNLTQLSLNNNRLESLPATFSALNMIRRIDLECNNLRSLPDNFDNLTNCEVLNLNRNKLMRLPRSIGAMPSLTSLSASWNELTQLPSELCHSRTLAIIRLAMNKITTLPERLGQLSETLTELTVEYNQLRVLPLSFYKLRRLNVFRCEGNDGILDPPPEILIQGARAVVQYCVNQYFYDKDARMRHIVLCMQNILHQVLEKNLFDAAFFEADAHLPYGDDDASQDPDGWYVLQMPYFWETLLPKLRSIWLVMEQQGVFDVSNYSNDNVTEFDFTEKEVMWALTHYSDAMGPVLRRQPARFRRCACVDPLTKQRKPCIPPKVGYMCERSATWIKSKVVRDRDKAERKWSTYKVDHENDAVRRAELEALQYLNSRVGQRWLDETAADQADDVLLEQTVDKIVQKRIAKTEKAKEKVLNKFEKKIARVQRIKDDKFNKLQQEVTSIKDQLRITREGYLKSVLEKKLEERSKEMADIPEIEQLQNLQRQLQKEIEQLDADLYKGIESDDDTAAKKKRKRQKHKKKKNKKSKKGTNNGGGSSSSDENDGSDGKEDDDGSGDDGGAASDLTNDDDGEDKTDAFVSDEEDDLIECMDSDELREVVERDRRDFARGEQLYDSDDSCSEARAYRRLRMKRMKRLKQLEEAKSLQHEQARHVERQIQQLQDDRSPKTMRLAVDLLMLQASHRNRLIAEALQQTAVHKLMVKPMKRYLREQRVLARRKLRDLVEVSKIRTAKVLRRLNGDFNEVVRELKYEIRRQYLSHAMQEARNAARHEFAVIERVRSKMLGASLEMTFIAWKKYVWTKTVRERREKRRTYKQACKHYETSMESVRSAQIQADMWHYQVDIYSDRAYWQHKRTGDITYDQPTMYHYLPWNFILPTLPEELPSDISLNTTDDSDMQADEDQRRQQQSGVITAKGKTQLDAQQSQALSTAVLDTFAAQHGGGGGGGSVVSQGSTIDKNKRRQADGPANAVGQPSEAPTKRSIHEELLRWQKKYGRKRHAAEEADERKRAQRRAQRQRYHARVTAAAAETTAKLAGTMTTTTASHGGHQRRGPRTNRFGVVLIEDDTAAHDGDIDEYNGDGDGGDYGDDRVLTAMDTSELMAPLEVRVAAAAENAAQQSKQEFEIAYKAIRRKRNQLNPNRHQMYMSHVNRKPKSMEQWRDDNAINEAKAAREHALEIEPGVFIDDRKIDMVHPSEADLLRMAGATVDMIHTGKAGLELRSVIAARAVHIKEKLHERAIERGLISRTHDHNTVYRKEIKPFFMHRYDGSSSSENTDDDDDDNNEDDEEEKNDGSVVGGLTKRLFGLVGLGPRKKTVSKYGSVHATRDAALDPQGRVREGKKAREKHRTIHRQLKEERHRERQYVGKVEDTHAERREAVKLGGDGESVTGGRGGGSVAASNK